MFSKKELATPTTDEYQLILRRIVGAWKNGIVLAPSVTGDVEKALKSRLVNGVIAAKEERAILKILAPHKIEVSRFVSRLLTLACGNKKGIELLLDGLTCDILLSEGEEKQEEVIKIYRSNPDLVYLRLLEIFS